ncbi:nuclear transport factor 2 family protein [Aureisphaera sp. CAU 1614]|uniref:Nuclear transport factor 2 family protein n=1 Tax=Halomarinibacterium sedimenti TaxID=2857106 RepID=A0A9X1FNT1_9FLAO|nr:nuclear transport factor 2 family protein [Halomarinibacterium sedimenti]MBW2937770.1 nuclear transport factor 2 family protein [Halomarinibacterium sedimenti]
MKLLITMVFVSISAITFSQDSFSENDAKELIDTFFEGFHQGDTLTMKRVMVENLPNQTVFTNKEGKANVIDGNISEFLKAIANRPADQVWEEKLLDYKVQIDGNLAHVWTPYEFWFNGNFSHCGANAFTLAKTEDGWKIVHLIDSRRKEGCKD